MTSEPPASRWLVTTDWLAARLGAPDLVVLDGSYYLAPMKRDAEAEYLAGHIPGAVRFDIDQVADHSSALPHMLPTPEAFAAAGSFYDKTTAKKLHDAIMSVGNSISPEDAFRRFRGRDVDTNALMRDRGFPVA